LIRWLSPALKFEHDVRRKTDEKEGVMETEYRPQVLADLVAYQDGSVVSKTLIEKETGTVTLFAFAQGQGLSEHTAPFDAMVSVLDGTADITIAGKPIQVGSGQMVIMPADVPHALKAIGPFKMILTMIRS
jgi:quercetin dioxygenase-like cupin family protein